MRKTRKRLDAGGAVQSVPSTVPSLAALMADGFSTEYVG